MQTALWIAGVVGAALVVIALINLATRRQARAPGTTEFPAHLERPQAITDMRYHGYDGGGNSWGGGDGGGGGGGGGGDGGGGGGG